MVTRVPLAALLSWGWIAFTIEADNAFEAAGSERVGRLFRISLPMWANGLRFIGADGTLGLPARLARDADPGHQPRPPWPPSVRARPAACSTCWPACT